MQDVSQKSSAAGAADLRTVLLPNVELNMEGVTVAAVHIKPGDRVEIGQVIAAVETQKATVDIHAEEAGFVREVFVKVGQEVGEKAPLCSIGDAPPGATPAPAAGPAAGVDARPGGPAAATPAAAAPAAARGDTPGKVRAAPAARRLAKEQSIALEEVPPTGPNGRVTSRDVEAFAAASSALAAAAGPGGAEGWHAIPPLRAALVAQMEAAARTIPLFSLSRLVDVTPLARKEEGITLTHRLIACLGAALEAHPSLLTTIDGGRMRTEEVAVAIAMDSRSGLVAPAVRQPQRLSLQEISATVKLLKARADAGQLQRADLERAPFAVSNLGMYGVDQFQPSVFAGQCAVLGTGRATDAAAGHKVAWFTLACDHRAVDGAEAARFLQTLQDRIRAA
jgi:pyruvate dehydrogenase E2 component (dihydrolipoamide acetyltransferase)